MKETKVMKHSKKYLDSKFVVQHSSKYDKRDVLRAKLFVEGYEDCLITLKK